ncbi:FAD-binding oxidoreductase [Candidatus Woesearchaeota archaeon]|nr:FAD-binding oxidoreductase [Candidatus Woesearchaeota archaeon]
MNKRIASIVGAENVSDSAIDIEAYSYCCSERELKPSLVIWPRNAEQAQRMLLFANQGRTPVVLRGKGTTTSEGCIADNALVLSSERMNKITFVDLNNKLVEVEAGMSIHDLNNSLRSVNVMFPVVPLNPGQTIGGMVALNALSKQSQLIGRVNEWVEKVEFVDGTGKSFFTKKKEDVVGREGLSGFITKAQLRVVDIPSISLEFFHFNELTDLLNQVRLLRKDKEVYFLEFFDRKTSNEMGFELKYSLMAAYTSFRGKIKNAQEIKEWLDKADSAVVFIRSSGYYYMEDPFVSFEKAYDLIEWCEKHDVRLQGHIGLGAFYAYFQKKDRDLLDTFSSFLRRTGGKLGDVFGTGIKNKLWVSQEKKKEFIKLKEEYDYNNILNPDKIINYR